MKRISIQGDGNCCFSAVAHGLLNSTFPSSLNIRHPQLDLSSISVLSQQLREIIVKEWRENAEYYAGFLVEGNNIMEEAEKFLQAGIFDSDLGDSATTLANALGIHFVVFTTLE